jgi:hypothetical protein
VPARVIHTGLALLLPLAAGACALDPIYLLPPAAIEVGADGMTFTGTAQLTLPVRLETAEEAAERAARAAEIGAMVPFVTRADLLLSVEWTIKNLSGADGVARIQLNGANEWFGYAPLAFVTDPDDEEAPPPLAGNVPYLIPGGTTRSGVFREDQLAEASLDLELITRGGLNPFAALLAIHEDLEEIDAGGVAVPLDALASLVRLDLILIADRHMVMEYAVRVRDRRRPALLHPELHDAPAGELTGFAPADFAPAPP